MTYDIKTFFKYTGVIPGNGTYEVDDLHQLWVFCRGDRAQLEKMVGYTPFELQDDIFVLGVGDFAKGTGWADASLVMPITFEGRAGGNYYFEYEDQHASVASGREVWGYPKALAHIDWDESETGVRTRVYDYDTEVFSIEVEYDDAVDDSAWRHLEIYPQYQVRSAPQLRGDSFDLFEVVSRDPSVDYTPKQRLLGRAKVEIGKIDIANGILEGEPLRIVEVLGAEMRIGDYKSTPENGVPHVVKKLI